MPAAAQLNRRKHERFALNPMYTSIEVCDTRKKTPSRTGHIYDISEAGARIELDEAVKPGRSLRLRLDLPGAGQAIEVRGAVVRVNDDQDDPGPRRIALQFGEFATDADHERLVRYLGSGHLRRAA
jgi:hypothetical protein